MEEEEQMHDPMQWLTHQVMQQQGLITQLKRQVEDCREEVGALRECLECNGLVDSVRFLVHLHRRRFNSAKAIYGLGPYIPLDAVVDVRAVALSVGTFAGSSAMKALRESCSGVGPATTDVLDRLCPGHLYLCGGFEGALALSSVERLDPQAGTWEALPPMMEARQYTCAGVISSMIYVCGGWAGPQPVRSVERFEPTQLKWEQMPPMLVARWGAGAGVLNKKLYVCGGLDESRQPLHSVECFKPPSCSSITHRAATPAPPPLPPPLSPRGELSVDENSWQVAPAMSERRGWPAAASLGGLLYVCGGRDEQREPLSSVERLSAIPNLWLPLPPLSSQRAGAAAAAAGGKLYVCGGAFGAQMLNSVERFDPKVGVWETLPPMSARRAYVASAAIAGGVHVFGGSDGGQCLGSAERFDPLLGTWTPLSSLQERRSGAASAAVLI